MRGEGHYATNVRAVLHHDIDGFADEVAVKGETARITRYCDLYHAEKDVAIEIKSCSRDLHSGYGLNWIGKYNWLVCPGECVIEAAEYLDARDENFVGIMAWETDRDWSVEDVHNVSDEEYASLEKQGVVIRRPKPIY